MDSSRLKENASGVFAASVTPFDELGEVDFASVDQLVEFYVNHQVSGIAVLGLAGEAGKLSESEAQDFLQYYIQRVAGRVPVVVGVSNPGIGNLSALARFAIDAGAAGVLVAPPAGPDTEQKLYRYLYDVADALSASVPWVYQDCPPATGVHISVELLLRAVRDFPNLVMLNHADWPGLGKLSSFRGMSTRTGTRRVSVLAGDGCRYLPQQLMRGADGALAGFAYPEMPVEVVRLHQAGRSMEASDVFDLYLPLVTYDQQGEFGLAARKEILRRRGAINHAATRAPGVVLNREDYRELSGLMSRLERHLSPAPALPDLLAEV